MLTLSCLDLDGELSDSHIGKNVSITYNLNTNLNKKSGSDVHQEMPFKPILLICHVLIYVLL